MSQAPTCDNKLKLEPSWKAHLVAEFEKPYMCQLRQFLKAEKQKGKTIFPRGHDIFRAFELTPIDTVKVVIIGQDPYHGPNQAHGLCFSVRPGIKPPPSLVNIYKEMQADIGVSQPDHGCLESWAQQGVLLLNAVLTVQMGQAASHQGKGWEQFTDEVIAVLNRQPRSMVFVLWGAYAQRKGQAIDESKHHIIRSVHPSPLSAHRGFFGSKPFSKINAYLQQIGQTPIEWALPKLS